MEAVVDERGTQTSETVPVVHEYTCKKLHKFNHSGIYFEDMAMFVIHKEYNTN
ncbi:hypothetical protein DPMN_091338 [Dreissena polymorpha]|uniref:Uncharacterized protein n=1 Tax=Dreissena polymorpha TaxID=45954 RepID=A0A9D4QZV9_DREPO|nr:hypothetical protein DPMN_091338 [Dreissena polymorpha]